MKFCSECGSASLEYRIPAEDHFKRMICSDCGKIYYSNPKIVVGTIPVYQNKVLLAKRGIEPQKGKWNLPAGFLELGEDIETGARRENAEETSSRIKSLKLHSVFSSPSNHLYIFFLAELLDDYFETNSESPEISFFDLSEIPWDDVAFDSNVYALKSLVQGPLNPQLIDIKYTF